MSSEDYPASALERYVDHADTVAWLRAHPHLDLNGALQECDDPHVLVRLWAESDLELWPAYHALREFNTAQAADLPTPHDKDARDALQCMGRWLSLLERLRQRRRVRRLRATGDPRLVAVAACAAEATDATKSMPYGARSSASSLSERHRAEHVALLDTLIGGAVTLATTRSEGAAEGSVFREALPQQEEARARRGLAEHLRAEAARALAAQREREERALRARAPGPAAAPAQPPKSLALVLGSTLLLGTVLPVVAALVSTRWGALSGFLVGGLLGTVGVVGLGLRVGGEAGWLGAALALFGMIAGAMGGPSTLALAFGRGRSNVPLATLVEDPEASWYTLSDARVNTDLTYTRRVTGRDHESGRTYSYHHAIAPIVSDTWRPGEPIVAWAYCTERGASGRYARCRADWREPLGGVLRAAPMSHAEMLETQRLATVGGPRRLGAGAPIFTWTEDPVAHMRREARTGAALLGVTYLIGAGTIVVRRVRRRD